MHKASILALQTSKRVNKKKKEADDRNEVVKSTVEELKQLHDSPDTHQCNSGSELKYNGGIHSSLDAPPSSTMFVRAVSKIKKASTLETNSNDSSQAITQIASVFKLLPNATTNST